MHLYYEELNNYINKINQLPYNLVIAPSNIYLLEFINKCKHQISSQDICYIEEGNYTSKVSWRQIKSIGVNYSIIGHSEKNEDITKTNLKLKTCLENDIKPILCFGSKENPISLIDKLTENITSINNIIFAYEPIKNIGQSSININKVKNDINTIYDYLENKYHTKPTLLYGGGITKENISEIYHIDRLQGILIGSISSNIKELEKTLSRINEK